MAMRKGKHTSIHRATGATGFDMSLQDIMDGVEDRLVVIDGEYRVKFANAAVQRSLRGGAESPIGRHCYEVFQGRSEPCRAPLWECPLAKVLQSGSPTAFIHPHHTLDAGSVPDRYVKVALYPLRDGYGNINAVVELRRDVTAERELETQILRRRHRLQSLSRISGAVSGLWDLDAILNMALDTVLEIVNGTIGGILLFDEQTQRLCYRAHRGLSAKYAGEMCLIPGQGIAGKVAQTGEPILLKDISEDPRAAHADLISAEGLRAFLSIPLVAKDKVVGVMNVASHMPGEFTQDDMHLLNLISYQLGTAIEQARLYERLSKARERYQILLQQALSAQEQERKRIARELHDETSQTLTGLALSLQATIDMAEMSGIGNAEFVAKLKKVHSLSIHASTELSKLIKELRPTLLDALGLPAAIRRYAEDSLQPRGIDVSVESRGMDERLPSEIEVELFRIAQGAIGNIVEHSEAKNATILLQRHANLALMHIEDDGKGFDVSKLTGVDDSGRGSGLFTMKERARRLGGSCSVKSQPGRRTKVIVGIPIKEGMADAEDKSAGSG